MNIIKSMTFLTLLLFISCSISKNEPEPKGNVFIKKIMPPMATFNKIKNHLDKVSWHLFIDQTKPMVKEEFLGIQLGSLFVNWSISAINKQTVIEKTISQHILEYSREVDIDEDAVFLELKSRIDTIGQLMDRGDKASYRWIRRDIQNIRSVLKEYFRDKKESEVIAQINFGIWLEFLYFGARGMTKQYEEKAAPMFHRKADVNHFLQIFKKQESDPNNQIIHLLNKIEAQLPSSSDQLIQLENLESISQIIKKFKDNQLNVP